MSAKLRQRFAYLRRIRTDVGGAEHTAHLAHVTFERREWSFSVRAIERATNCAAKVAALTSGEHPDQPEGIDLDTPEVRSYLERADNARRASMVVAARLAPTQAAWTAQTASNSDFPLNGWTPAPTADAGAGPTDQA